MREAMTGAKSKIPPPPRRRRDETRPYSTHLDGRKPESPTREESGIEEAWGRTESTYPNAPVPEALLQEDSGVFRGAAPSGPAPATAARASRIEGRGRPRTVPPPVPPPRPGSMRPPPVPPSTRAPAGAEVSNAELKDRIARSVLQMQGLRDKLREREAEIGALKSRLMLVDARVVELEELLRQGVGAEKADLVDRLVARVDELEDLAKRVRAGDAALRKILQGHKKRDDVQSDTQSKLEERLQMLEASVRARDHRIDALEAELEVVKAQPIASAPSSAPTKNSDGTDDLQRIRGIGPKYAQALQALGVERFEQIAAWDEAELARVAEAIGTRSQRIERYDWVSQARALCE